MSPIRVGVVHNFYRTDVPSGENRTVQELVDQLRTAGLEVEEFFRFSDDIDEMSLVGKARLPFSMTRSPSTVRDFAGFVQGFRPDVVQVHNVYPLVSPAVISTAKQSGAFVAAFVHNYRLACLPGSLRRDGANCADCVVAGTSFPGVLHGCYRGSRSQSAALATSLRVHRSTWESVDRFVAISEFVAEFLRSIGISEDRIFVRPNTVSDPGPVEQPWAGRVLFPSRLDQEKGIDLVLDAWDSAALPGCELVVAGSGPMAPAVHARADKDPSVTYLGSLSPEQVQIEYQRAQVVVAAPVWNEPFGRTVIEAFAHGRPVVGTAVGGLPELIEDATGWLVEPDPLSLRRALAQAADPQVAACKGAAARRLYERAYRPERSSRQLVELYSGLVGRS